VEVGVRRIEAHGSLHQPTRPGGTNRLAMADGRAAPGVSHVALEAHGGYWKPISNILESRFRVRRVNAHHLKQVPGRPSDVRDGPGIAPLLPQGLWQGSFLPPQREGRDLTRPRTQLVEAKGRTRKEGGRQPPAVARDIWGRARLEALPGGSGPAGGPGAAEAARQNPAAGEGTRRPRTPAF